MDPSELLRTAGRYRLSQAIYAAAALGVADHLVGGQRSAAQLATALGVHADSLRRLMRALASEGVFVEGEDGRFGLAPGGSLLVTGAGAREIVLGWSVFPPTYRAFGLLTDAVRTGDTAFEMAHGSDFHAYLAANPSAARDYDAAMTETDAAFDSAAATYDFTGIETLVDVGGGWGGLISAILRRYPAMRGVLFDLPAVIDGIQPGQIPAGVDAQITLVGGDFFAGPLPAGDGYILATVLRLFDDERAAALLRNIRSAMHVSARMLVLDFVHPPGPLVAPYGLADIQAMVVYGGRDRSASEFGELFAVTGLRLSRVLEAGDRFSWVEAVVA